MVTTEHWIKAATKLSLLLFLPGVIAACPPPIINYNWAALKDPSTTRYRVQPGDVLRVRVLRNESTSGSYMVNPDGRISMPLGGEIMVRGLNTQQVREKIVGRLKKFITDASDVVSVSLEQVHGITYSVIGEVNRAGMFDSTRYVTVLEALARAGGPNAYAKRYAIYVLRRSGSQQQRIPFSYPSTVKNPSGNRNFYLQSGDIIVVP